MRPHKGIEHEVSHNKAGRFARCINKPLERTEMITDDEFLGKMDAVRTREQDKASHFHCGSRLRAAMTMYAHDEDPQYEGKEP